VQGRQSDCDDGMVPSAPVTGEVIRTYGDPVIRPSSVRHYARQTWRRNGRQINGGVKPTGAALGAQKAYEQRFRFVRRGSDGVLKSILREVAQRSVFCLAPDG
jgi:hypothetical protein